MAADAEGPKGADSCEHGIPHPSWLFWTYSTHMEMRKPTHRIALVDSRDCPECLRARIDTLRWAFQELLYAFAPGDNEPRPKVDGKRFSAAYNAFQRDLLYVR